MKRIGYALWAVVLVLCLAACSTASHPSPTSTISPEPKEDTTVDTHTFYLTVEGVTFPATFADNQGAEALADLLTDGPLTLSLEDYGSFEKVGSLGQSLPTSNPVWGHCTVSGKTNCSLLRLQRLELHPTGPSHRPHRMAGGSRPRGRHRYLLSDGTSLTCLPLCSKISSKIPH